MLTTQLNIAQIPEVYERFSKVIGDSHWKRRVASLKAEARGNPLLTSLHRQENSIAFELERLRELRTRFDRFKILRSEDQALLEAASLAAQILSVLQNFDAVMGERFRQRIRGAFNNPAEMRAIKLELAAATHFLRAGHTVSWPEMSPTTPIGSRGVPDLLIHDVGADGLEVECKSFSQAKGRRVARRDALEFFGLLKKRHGRRLHVLHAGMVGVITLTDDLPSAHQPRVALVDAVMDRLLGKAVDEGSHQLASVSIFPTDPAKLEQLRYSPTAESRRLLIDEVSKTKNKEAMLQVHEEAGALLLVLQSLQDDTMLSSIFSTLRDSAPRQFSGTRPGIFVTRVAGLSADQVWNLSKRDSDPDSTPTGLKVHMSRFLASESRDHVVGVSLLSEARFGSSRRGSQDSGGTVYHFNKRSSPHWHDDLDNLFGSVE